jgi:hypothetical protein
LFALTANDREWHHHTFADFDSSIHTRADLNDFTHEFTPHHVALLLPFICASKQNAFS